MYDHGKTIFWTSEAKLYCNEIRIKQFEALSLCFENVYFLRSFLRPIIKRCKTYFLQIAYHKFHYKFTTAYIRYCNYMPIENALLISEKFAKMHYKYFIIPKLEKQPYFCVWQLLLLLDKNCLDYCIKNSNFIKKIIGDCFIFILLKILQYYFSYIC